MDNVLSVGILKTLFELGGLRDLTGQSSEISTDGSIMNFKVIGFG